MCRLSAIILTFFFSIDLWSQEVIDTTMIFNNQLYRLQVISYDKENAIYQIKSSNDSFILSQDTAEYSKDIYIKQQDVNNDNIPDLLFFFDKDYKFINLIYACDSSLKPFHRITMPQHLKKNSYGIHSIDYHKDYFYFIKYGLCVEKGLVQPMTNIYIAILFKIGKDFKVETIAELNHWDCKSYSNVYLNKFVNNKKIFIKTINEKEVMDDYLNLIYFKDHFDELIKK